jgi:hypothetical protein
MNVSGRSCRQAATVFTHELITRRTTMNKLLYTAMAFAVLGLTAGANVAVAAEKKGMTSYECFTDDGYGRKLPCSYSFSVRKAAANRYDCFTDDGYGRKLPCSYSIKRH